MRKTDRFPSLPLALPFSPPRPIPFHTICLAIRPVSHCAAPSGPSSAVRLALPYTMPHLQQCPVLFPALMPHSAMPVTLSHSVLCPALPTHFLPCLDLSYSIPACPDPSHPILSCPSLPCSALPCPALSAMSCLALPHPRLFSILPRPVCLLCLLPVPFALLCSSACSPPCSAPCRALCSVLSLALHSTQSSAMPYTLRCCSFRRTNLFAFHSSLPLACPALRNVLSLLCSHHDLFFSFYAVMH